MTQSIKITNKIGVIVDSFQLPLREGLKKRQRSSELMAFRFTQYQGKWTRKT